MNLTRLSTLTSLDDTGDIQHYGDISFDSSMAHRIHRPINRAFASAADRANVSAYADRGAMFGATACDHQASISHVVAQSVVYCAVQREVNDAVIVRRERLGEILDSENGAKGVNCWLPEGRPVAPG